jgi:hypothetical protein
MYGGIILIEYFEIVISSGIIKLRLIDLYKKLMKEFYSLKVDLKILCLLIWLARSKFTQNFHANIIAFTFNNNLTSDNYN